MKITLRLFAAGLIAVFIASCGKPDVNVQMQAYIDAHNAHDLDKVMELYHDSATFIFNGEAEIKGKSAIRMMESWNVAVNNQLEVSDIKVKGDTVLMGKITEKNDWLEAAGINGITHQPGTYVVFKKGLIYEFAPIAMEPESFQKMAEFWKLFTPYAQYKRADDLKKMFTEDQLFNYDPANAQMWIGMIRDWKITQDTVLTIKFN
jgi:hypothetical protein